MNASELRQQQQQAANNCAMNGDDPASHAIYTSLASCTVYEDGQGNLEPHQNLFFFFLIHHAYLLCCFVLLIVFYFLFSLLLLAAVICRSS